MKSFRAYVRADRRLRIWLVIGLAIIAASALARFEAQSIEVEAMCGDRLSVTWKSPPGARGYQFTSIGEGGGKVRCSPSQNKCVITGLDPGKLYGYYLDRVTNDGIVFGDAIQLRGASTGPCDEYIAVTPTPRPPVDSCAHLPSEIVVSGFRPFSTQCRRVGKAGVGNAELIAQGIRDAVDIWGNVDAEMRVCFREPGSLKFLDAATAPRALSDLPAERIDGMTCGRINRVGTVVLMQGGAQAIEKAEETSDSQPDSAQTGPSSTTICQLHTTGRLSLRAGPSAYYARILSMPRGARLVARARIGDWFMVRYQGQLGWASIEYLAASPGCDGLGEAGAIILPPVIGTPVPAAVEAMKDSSEAMSARAATTMAESIGRALSGCQLTAVDIINLRAGPGVEYDIYAEIPFEASLSAMAIHRDWFKVEYEGLAGWVSREYVFRWGTCDAASAAVSIDATPVSVPTASEADAPETTGENAQSEMPDIAGAPLTGCNLRTGDIINLREGPGLDYGVIAEIPYRTSLIAVARSGDWFKVDYQAETGWVHIDYVFRNGACG